MKTTTSTAEHIAKQLLGDDDFPDVSMYITQAQTLQQNSSWLSFFRFAYTDESKYVVRILLVETIAFIVMLSLIAVAWRYYYSYIQDLFVPTTPVSATNQNESNS